MTPTADMLDAHQTAVLLGVSRSTLTRLKNEGVILPANPKSPHLKRPRRLLFRRDDVERLAQPMQQAG